MTEQEAKQILERLLSTKDVLVGKEYTAVSIAISALSTVSATKAEKAHKITTIPEEKLLRRLEEIEGEFADWHISAHKSDLLYEEKADIEKELARRNTLKETSSKPSEPSYEVVYSEYCHSSFLDIGLVIETNEDNSPKRVLSRFNPQHNMILFDNLEIGFAEYGSPEHIDWKHTYIFLTKEEWKNISYKKSPSVILQKLHFKRERTDFTEELQGHEKETYSPSITR